MTKNNTICFFPGDLNPGGIGHLMMNLSEELIRRGYSVHFFLTNRNHLIEDELPKGVKVFKSGNSVKGTLFGLIRYIRDQRPLAVISGRDSLNVVNVLACKLSAQDVKSITSVHVDYSSEKLIYKNLKQSLHRFVAYILGMLFYRFADETIAVSKGVATNHAKRFFLNKRKIRVIYNPAYKEINDAIKDSDAKKMIDKLERPIIISVGRLTRQKGFEDLYRAFSLFKKKNKSGSLLILGEGEERQSLEKLARDLKIEESTHMPGYLKNPLLYIKHSDIFVLSSLWEGFGNVIVEALSVGATIVSTDCKSGPKEILGNGRFGTLVPPSDFDALSEAIGSAINSPVNPNAQIERAKNFSVQNITDQYLEVIL